MTNLRENFNLRILSHLIVNKPYHHFFPFFTYLYFRNLCRLHKPLIHDYRCYNVIKIDINTISKKKLPAMKPASSNRVVLCLNEATLQQFGMKMIKSF